MTINKEAQYASKFSRLWERFDEASHGNAEQMRDILEVTLDALESAERHILRLEKFAEAESVGADKAATSCVEWMKRCQAAEKQIADLFKENVRLKSGIAGLVHLGIRHGDIEVMRIAGDAQMATPWTDSIIEKIAAGIGVKGE